MQKQEKKRQRNEVEIERNVQAKTSTDNYSSRPTTLFTSKDKKNYSLPAKNTSSSLDISKTNGYFRQETNQIQMETWQYIEELYTIRQNISHWVGTFIEQKKEAMETLERYFKKLRERVTKELNEANIHLNILENTHTTMKQKMDTEMQTLSKMAKAELTEVNGLCEQVAKETQQLYEKEKTKLFEIFDKEINALL